MDLFARGQLSKAALIKIWRVVFKLTPFILDMGLLNDCQSHLAWQKSLPEPMPANAGGSHLVGSVLEMCPPL